MKRRIWPSRKPVKQEGGTPRTRWFEVSYDEMDSLLTNIGVLSALMLTLAIPLFSSISTEDFLNANYRWMLVESEDFRKTVAWHLGEAHFNFVIPMGPNVTFDVKAALELPRECGVYWSNARLDEACLTYLDTMETLYHATQGKIPNCVVSTGAKSAYYVNNIRRNYVLSVTLLTIVLLLSLLLYVSITVSGSQEREDKMKKDSGTSRGTQTQEGEDEVKNTTEDSETSRSTQKANGRSRCELFTWGCTMFLVCAMYITTIASSYLVFWGFADIVYFRYPDVASTHVLMTEVAFRMQLFVLGSTVVVSVVVYIGLQISLTTYSVSSQQSAPEEASSGTAQHEKRGPASQDSDDMVVEAFLDPDDLPGIVRVESFERISSQFISESEPRA